MLYAVNTAGAAAGAFLADFLLVPAAGVRATQIVAVLFNVVAGVGALWIARVKVRVPGRGRHAGVALGFSSCAAYTSRCLRRARQRQAGSLASSLFFTALALALSGFAAMGMEILWVRHFTLLLGGFRAVFSLVLTMMLVGIGAGSLLGGWIDRRTGRPAEALMLIQGLFVAAVLAGLGSAAFSPFAIEGRALAALTPLERWGLEIWYNARPILLEAGLPSLLMGCSFPLANAVVQRAEQNVGRRAGMLYFVNTAGAVCGSLIAGYVLLPVVGMQGHASMRSRSQRG